MDSSRIDVKVVLSKIQRRNGLFFILAFGIAICLWELGSTGLVDETPPLFAAAGRAMSKTGDWLTPRVNGLPRYDKPPLFYWLMSLLYALPGKAFWDPFGSWAARLPSALSTLWLMLFLGDTVMRWPQNDDLFPRRTGVAVALAFVLSPFVLIWSRIAVSDALLCSTLGTSMLLQWRRYANPIAQPWWVAWFVLGLAILTKGPVAVALMGLTLALFSFLQQDLVRLWERLHPLKGLLIASLISLPWYLAELFVEGQPFWDSFFGYHNFQRFTSVVNSHSQPWWFFGPMLLVASLPFSALLILGLVQVFTPLWRQNQCLTTEPHQSLRGFVACWLIAVFFLFTCAATKLPSYWLPATPAAAILIGFAANESTFRQGRTSISWAWCVSVLISLLLAAGLCASPIWIKAVSDPEMPSLAIDLIDSGLALKAASCFCLTAFIGTWMIWRPTSLRLLTMQGPLVLLQLIAFLPMWKLADELRQEPLRNASALMVSSQRINEPLVMVGAMKPSVHFYTEQVVVHEGRSPGALVNLSDRLRNEKRQGWFGTPIEGRNGSSTALVVIDQKTTLRQHWKGVDFQVLGEFGIYLVVRLDRYSLEKRANELRANGLEVDWRSPRPERF